MNIVNEENDALHGEKVGVGLAMVCDLYHGIMALDDLEDRITDNNQMPKEKIDAMFKDVAEGIYKENSKNPLEDVKKENIIAVLPIIKNIIDELPTGDEMREILRSVGCPCTLSDIGLSEDLKETIYYYAPFVRARLTFMRFAHMIERG
jgi:glycerol-1-phosphate dehydrogenase [NAD(P)+]